MRQVNIQVIDNALCAQSYSAGVVIESTLCTSTAGGRGICTGDSGGPLYIGSGSGRLLVSVFCLSMVYLTEATTLPSFVGK